MIKTGIFLCVLFLFFQTLNVGLVSGILTLLNGLVFQDLKSCCWSSLVQDLDILKGFCWEWWISWRRKVCTWTRRKQRESCRKCNPKDLRNMSYPGTWEEDKSSCCWIVNNRTFIRLWCRGKTSLAVFNSSFWCSPMKSLWKNKPRVVKFYRL